MAQHTDEIYNFPFSNKNKPAQKRKSNGRFIFPRCTSLTRWMATNTKDSHNIPFLGDLIIDEVLNVLLCRIIEIPMYDKTLRIACKIWIAEKLNSLKKAKKLQKNQN